ncbi:hypothetical protein ACJJTC_001443 [Scirpophaga incertulas]
MKCLRAILRVKWQDRVPNSEILRRAKMTGMESLLMRNQLRWCGHLVRMESFRSLTSKRQHRKTRPKPSYDYTYDSNGNLYCASCNRTFKSKFGFASHARAHARRDQGMS